MNTKLIEYISIYNSLSNLENVSLNFGPVKDINTHPLEQVYLANIFKNLQQSPDFHKYHFYIISSNSKYDFKFDKMSIVFYMSNEDHQIPDNILKAKAIFTPYCPVDRNQRPDNCYPIPLGYNGSQEELPFIDIKDRYFDTFFSGNIHRRRILFYANSLLMINLRKASKVFKPENRKNFFMFSRKFTGGLSPAEYSEILMNTKIALVPEGYISNISFRFFEAARFGCVIISSKLYDYWFFKDFPGIQINHWGQLYKKVRCLLKNPTLLMDIQNQTLNYYQKNCSEEAVSDYVLKHL